MLNDVKAIGIDLDEACSTRHSLLGRPVSLKHWERFRLLSPKMTGSLARISQNGTYVTDVSGISQAVLLGREFWVNQPPELPDILVSEQNTPEMAEPSDLPPPPLSTYQKCIATSLNTSPGIDGIPYSAFRATWSSATVLLQAVMLAIITVTFPCNPTQLLVWIPKAIAGDLPDHWRPLNMPRVFDRLLDKVVFAHAYDWFASVLHKAQSLI
jgi:hypothetical protein